MPQPIMVAVIAFFAAIVGGLIQAALTSRRERRNFRWTINRDNYSLYIQAMINIQMSDTDSEDYREHSAKAIEAGARIMLQGSLEVIDRLEDIALDEHDMDSEEFRLQFASLIAAMRKDIGGSNVSRLDERARSILFAKQDASEANSACEDALSRGLDETRTA